MAYNPNPPQQKYIASAGQTSFPYLFRVFQDSDLVVYNVESGSDPELAVPLVLNIDYTVTINGDDGGTVILTTPAEDQAAVTLYRRLPLTRYVEYQTSGDLLAGTLNADQDYQTYLTSDLEDRVTEYLSGDAPGSTSDYVRKAGDTMTGPLNLPAGGSGAEAIQAQEILAITSANASNISQNATDISNIDNVNYGIINETNANGLAIKFPDGTMICRIVRSFPQSSSGIGSIYTGGTITWTFPVEFIADPTITVSSISSTYDWFSSSINNVTSCTLRRFSHAAITTTVDVTVVSIGRWK